MSLGHSGLSDAPNPPSSGGQGDDKGNDNGSKGKRKVKCICGVGHLFKDCPYVNPAVRPAHWTPDSDMQAKFENVQNPSVRSALNKAKEALKPESSPTPAPRSQPGNALNMSVYSDFKPDNARSFASSSSADYPLRDSWIADSGSDTHVCNNLERFESLEPAPEGHMVRHGDSETCILGFGIVQVHATSPNKDGDVPIRLHNVAFIPGMHTNLLSV